MRSIVQAAVCFLLSTTLFAAAGACPPATDQQRVNDLLNSDAFRRYAAAELGGVSLDHDVVLLAFDHARDRWAVYDWKNRSATLRKSRLTIVDEALQIETDGSVPVLMLVTSSNPLAYGANAMPITTVDSDEIANVKVLAAGLGQAAQSALSVARSKVSTQTAVMAQTDVGDSFDGRMTRLRDSVSEFEQSSKAAERAVADLMFEYETALSFIQLVEYGVRPSTPLLRKGLTPHQSALVLEKLRDEPRTIEAALANLRSARANVAAVVPQKSVASAAATAGDKWSAGTGSAALRRTLDDLQKSFDAGDARRPDDMALWRSASAEMLEAAVQRDSERSVRPGAAKDAATVEQPKRMALLSEVVPPANDALTKADALLAKRHELLKTAAWLREFAQTATLYQRTEERDDNVASADEIDACSYVDGIVAVRGGTISSVFDKKNRGGLHIAAMLPATEFVGRLPQSLDKKVDVTSTSKWGIGFGTVYTRLRDKSWRAMTDPTSDSRKVIGVAQESAVGGDIAVFAHLHPRWAHIGRVVDYGLQFGSNVDPKRPAFYLGASVDLGRWARIGGGLTSQRTTQLAAGQEEMKTVVKDDTDIRTRQAFRGSAYLSLSISLDGIPLFKPSGQ